MRLSSHVSVVFAVLLASLSGARAGAQDVGDAGLTDASDVVPGDAEDRVNKESVAAYCGDGMVTAYEGEECEPGVPIALACADIGTAGDRRYETGTLGCSELCRYDFSACGPAECGNHVLEDGETCEPEPSAPTACAYGEATCTVCEDCQWVELDGDFCGDGVVDTSYEACELGVAWEATCESLGYGPGELVCSLCSLDPRGCQGDVCGDGWVTSGEECDEPPQDTCPYRAHCRSCESCAWVEFDGGWCGDGIVEFPEACDRGELADTPETCPYGERCEVCEACALVPVHVYCGDGLVDADYETCDHGLDNTRETNPTCADPTLGCTRCSATCEVIVIEPIEESGRGCASAPTTAPAAWGLAVLLFLRRRRVAQRPV